MPYFKTRLSGVVAMSGLFAGFVIAVAPPFLPFVPDHDKALFSAIIMALSGLKAWISSSPIPTQ